MIGTVLSNRYKIIGELGSGGMAWVYLAEDLREDQLVAVKVLYPQYSQDPDFLTRFDQESKLSMNLSTCAPTRQIVCVLDYGSDRDIHYLVMEYVQGQDLSQILAERGPLPWQEALEIARQVGMALAHADKYEVVHRDIKPGNIMVLPDGAVRVMDFGIARARTSPHLTMNGFVGSPHYAAPEQVKGEKVDIRADIYALGIAIYQMLSGDLPFQGNTPWAIVNQQVEAPPPPLEEVRADLPLSVLRLVNKAMAKRPEDRFQNAEEMIEAIDQALAGQESPEGEPATQPDAATEAAAAAAVLYQRAQQATERESWHEAMDLYSQILKIDPGYGDVTKQLAAVSRQLRLATLYRGARRALQLGHWGQARNQLASIAGLDPDYKDIDELRAMAENQKMLEPDEHDGSADVSTLVEAPLVVPIVGLAGQGLDAGSVEGAAGVDEVERPTPGPALPPEPPGPAPDVPESKKRRNLLPWVIGAVLLLAVVLAAILSYRALSTPGIALDPTATDAGPATQIPGQSATPTSLPEVTTPEPGPSRTPTRLASPSPTPTPGVTPTAALTFTLPPPPTPEPPPEGQIAFPRFDPSRGTYDVHVCHVDGAACRQVAAESSQPDFLPGGTRLVVHTWKADDKGLILQALDGERIWKITSQFEAARPSVDWEGNLYTYHSRQEVDRKPRLYRTFDAETGAIRREASDVLGQSPSWTPDGHILYNGCWRDSCGIIRIDKDGSNPRQVIAGGAEGNPEASPDGQRLVFMSRRDGNWEVYVANMNGSGLQRLTKDPANDGLPTWSPDGRYIAFVSDRGDGWAVWVMRPDGTDQRHIFAIGPLDGRVKDASAHETHGWVEERISWAPLP